MEYGGTELEATIGRAGLGIPRLRSTSIWRRPTALILRARLWTRARPRGLLIVAHGLGEHGGCYTHVAEVLGPSLDLDVLAFDFRGHGRSPGRRGSLQRFDELADDLRGALAWAEARMPDRPRVLLGHSYGGLVAMSTLAADGDAGLAGLVLSNPALKLAGRVPRHKLLAAAFLRRYAPTLTLGTGIREEGMTRDPSMLALRASDTLRHSRICASIFYGMAETADRVASTADLIRLPTLMILGEADPLIDPSRSRTVFGQLGSPDKTLRIYPGMLHEPLCDSGPRCMSCPTCPDGSTTTFAPDPHRTPPPSSTRIGSPFRDIPGRSRRSLGMMEKVGRATPSSFGPTIATRFGPSLYWWEPMLACEH